MLMDTARASVIRLRAPMAYCSSAFSVSAFSAPRPPSVRPQFSRMPAFSASMASSAAGEVSWNTRLGDGTASSAEPFTCRRKPPGPSSNSRNALIGLAMSGWASSICLIAADCSAVGSSPPLFNPTSYSISLTNSS